MLNIVFYEKELNENLPPALLGNESHLETLKCGEYMFYEKYFPSFTADLSGLTHGFAMFANNTSLTTFNSNLTNLIDGEGMFADTGLETFTCSNLSNLIDGDVMFAACRLEKFHSNLDNLESGENMFAFNTLLQSWDTALPKLINGTTMFSFCGQLFGEEDKGLSSFTSDLPNLKIGDGMFGYCNKLENFQGTLTSLESAYEMFTMTILNPCSLRCIVETINTPNSRGNILIGLGCDDSDEARELFAQEAGYSSFDEIFALFDEKNWDVEFQFNGSPVTSYSMRKPSSESSLIWAKLKEVAIDESTDKHKSKFKPYYSYTSQDGTKFYNIHWYHDSNTTNEGYQQFNSLEEAISAYGVIPKN